MTRADVIAENRIEPQNDKKWLKRRMILFNMEMVHKKSFGKKRTIRCLNDAFEEPP